MSNGGSSRSGGWSRRGFLSARGVGAAAGGVLGELVPDPPLLGPQQQEEDALFGYWCVSRRAMACEFTVYVPPSVPNAPRVAEEALDEIGHMEDLLSVYRANSGVSYMNRYAAEAPVRVDDRLFRLLARSAELTRATGGAFDVSAGALVEAWGFYLPPKRVPSDAEREAALFCTGMDKLQLDEERLAVRFATPGLKVNLGSIGKGYAIDRALDLARDEHGVECMMIQGGLSSMRAVGSPADDGRGWLVGIQDPAYPARRVATVRLRNRALGTSGSSNQYFESEGRRFGHVLDPRTGRPADGLGSASALAADAATADAMATAFFVLGLDKTADFCQHHPEIAAVLVLEPEPGSGTGVLPRVVTCNLPPGDVHLSAGSDSPAD